jgi:hypothetical protein
VKFFTGLFILKGVDCEQEKDGTFIFSNIGSFWSSTGPG